jgi:hypothetical protein
MPRSAGASREQALARLAGLPSWLVEKGHGSFITLEFGQPELIIREPRMMHTMIEGAPSEAMRRLTSVRGQWHLMIDYCQWSLTLDGIPLADDESDDQRMHRALRVLNGQAITGISIDPVDATTRFSFRSRLHPDDNASPG